MKQAHFNPASLEVWEGGLHSSAIYIFPADAGADAKAFYEALKTALSATKQLEKEALAVVTEWQIALPTDLPA